MSACMPHFMGALRALGRGVVFARRHVDTARDCAVEVDAIDLHKQGGVLANRLSGDLDNVIWAAILVGGS